MALTFTIQPAKNANAPGSNIRKGQMAGGFTVAYVEMTRTDGTFGNDYSSGFAIRANAAKMGFHNIYSVIGLSAQKADGTTTLSDKLDFTWDNINGKLRCWTGSTGATNWTEETGSNLDQNSKVQMLVLGC